MDNSVTKANFLWDFQNQTNRHILDNQLNIMVIDKNQKTMMVIDIAVSSDSNSKKKKKKLEKYQGLREELETTWKVKVNVVPVVVRSLLLHLSWKSGFNR